MKSKLPAPCCGAPLIYLTGGTMRQHKPRCQGLDSRLYLSREKGIHQTRDRADVAAIDQERAKAEAARVDGLFPGWSNRVRPPYTPAELHAKIERLTSIEGCPP